MKLTLLVVSSLLFGSHYSVEAKNLAALAAKGDLAAAQSLRAAGPAGLETLLKMLEPEISQVRQNKLQLKEPGAAPWRAAVEEVAKQRDAWASGLYWFTDLEAAKLEAAKTGRRILSLRLLGNLHEEYSCANSRFFRTVLYANAEVSKVLRENYVLHWKSVRPAPLLTIDMGDGRRIKRTITGNSIHYLLDAQGQVLDALPGVYSPAAFLSALERAVRGTAGLISESLRQWHGKQAHDACVEWLAAAAKAGAYGPASQAVAEDPSGEFLVKLAQEAFPGSNIGHAADWKLNLEESLARRFAGNVKTVEAQSESVSRKPVNLTIWDGGELGINGLISEDPPKGMVERPVIKQVAPVSISESGPAPFPLTPALDALDPATPAQPNRSLSGRMTQEFWAKMAAPLRPLVKLDAASLRMMIQKLPTEIISASEATQGRPDNERTPFGRLLERFESSIAGDMVRNEFYYHATIHQWLEEDKTGVLTKDVEALNRKVYAELFLTPDYDAWLGLVPEDTYTALEKDGCACDPGAPSMSKVRR